MQYYSTNDSTHLVSLEQAVIQGLAPDNGLYMPQHINPMPSIFFETLHQQSFQDIAYAVAHHLIGADVDKKVLREMVEHTISFDAPLVELEENIFALELFHGPTLAFKDFGARFMSQLLGHFADNKNQDVTILVATSGDTGSAVANGFLGVKGIKVIVLYPAGKVSDIQEKQFTTLGQNITAVEVNGTFDDCQRLVKLAFSDMELQAKLFLTSANSINIARLIPQSFYYFYAWSRLNSKKVVFSVPSGNFGNLTAGLMAKRMGLPIHHFVAATNANDMVPQYLASKTFSPRASTSTISNAMDVGNPSNFARMLALYQSNWGEIIKDITGYSFSDEETIGIMQSVFQKNKYILDPHGAVGLLGLNQYQLSNKETTGVFLETAHPAKFREVVEKNIHAQLELPERLKTFLSGKKNVIKMGATFSEFKNILLTFTA